MNAIPQVTAIEWERLSTDDKCWYVADSVIESTQVFGGCTVYSGDMVSGVKDVSGRLRVYRFGGPQYLPMLGNEIVWIEKKT
jgi:hypothetical protein